MSKANPILEKGKLINPDNLIPIAPTTVNKIRPRKEMSEKQKANVEKLIALNRERAKERAQKVLGVIEDIENMPEDKLLFEVKAKREYVRKTDEEKLEELRQKVMNKKLQEQAKNKRFGKGTIEMPIIHEEKKEEKKEPTNQMMDMMKMMFEQQQKVMSQQPIVINNAVKKPRKKRATSMKKKFVSDTEDTDDTDFYSDTTETETDTDLETTKKANYKLKKLNEIEQRLNMYRAPPPTAQPPPRNMYSVFR
jgi:hypothetical protein